MKKSLKTISWDIFETILPLRRKRLRGFTLLLPRTDLDFTLPKRNKSQKNLSSNGFLPRRCTRTVVQPQFYVAASAYTPVYRFLGNKKHLMVATLGAAIKEENLPRKPVLKYASHSPCLPGKDFVVNFVAFSTFCILYHWVH